MMLLTYLCLNIKEKRSNRLTIQSNKIMYIQKRTMWKSTGELVQRTIRSRSPSPTDIFPIKKVELVSRKGSTLLPSNNPNLRGEYRGYATYAVRKPDPSNKDPQAVINNVKKPRQHPEIVREVCTKTDCKSKTCSTHCAPIIETKSIGHATHGTPKISHGTLVPGGETDLNNVDRQQNFVMYDQAHNTTTNQAEMEPQTTNLKNDTETLEKVKKHAK